MSALRARRTWRAPTRAQRRAVYLWTSVAAVVICALNVWHASYATFSGTTANPSSSFTAGTVAVDTGANGTALFTANDLAPGTTYTTCVVVTYTGNVSASVKLYGSAYQGDIGAYLNLAIDQGTGTNTACTDFSSTSSAYSGTLSGFVGSATNFGSGVGTYTPSTNGQTSTYRLSYSLQNSAAAQNRSGTVTLVWEAQST